MTTSQLFAIRPEFHQELPDLALSPHVIVTCDLRDDEPSSCGVCPDRGPYGVEPVGDGLVRIAYQHSPGGTWWHTDACGEAHAEQELAYLLGLRLRRHPYMALVLRVPEHWALKARKAA